jgi:GNAT superfamily N-acetyltransferase
MPRQSDVARALGTWAASRYACAGTAGIEREQVVTFALRRLALHEMDRAALVLRISFDDRLPWLAGMHSPEEDRAYFREQVFRACEVWGAQENAIGNEIVGIIAFRPGWVDQLYVLPNRQRRGVGSTLLELAKAGNSELQLWTFQRNGPARHFYERHGFEAVHETDGAGNEEREPDALYRWTVNHA